MGMSLDHTSLPLPESISRPLDWPAYCEYLPEKSPAFRPACSLAPTREHSMSSLRGLGEKTSGLR